MADGETMTITVDSPIVGNGHAWYRPPDDAARRVDLIAYANELARLCDLVGFDFRILFAQAWHETAGFTSTWWTERLNPAGLGITGDPKQNEQSRTWTSGEDAARAHVVHMAAYVFPTDDEAWNKLVDFLALDPRLHAVSDAGFAGTVEWLGDLGSGKWATDKTYAHKIAAKANAIFTEDPMADITYGLVPYPAVIASHLSSENPWINAGAPTIPEAVFWHRAIGTWEGTNGWFHAGKAATAYGVSVAATDGTGGKIYEWIARDSGLYGESSGPAVGPYGDGPKLIAKVGVNSVNRTTKAIEISGNYDTPLDPQSRAAIVALTAYFADQKHIPWTEFPNVPGEDRSFVIWHQEITGPAYKACPGTVVMNETSALIQRVADVLKQFQGGSQPTRLPQYAASDLPDWFADAVESPHPTDNRDGALRYNAIRRNFVCTHATRRLSAPDGDAKRSGPNVAVREKVYGEYQTANGYILTTDGHFIARSRLSPSVTFKS